MSPNPTPIIQLPLTPPPSLPPLHTSEQANTPGGKTIPSLRYSNIPTSKECAGRRGCDLDGFTNLSMHQEDMSPGKATAFLGSQRYVQVTISKSMVPTSD